MSDPFGAYNDGISFDARRPTPTPSPPPRAQPIAEPVKSTKSKTSNTSFGDENVSHNQPNNQTANQSSSKKPVKTVRPPDRVLREGYLDKKISMSVLPSWHARYFILAPSSIWYYGSEEEYRQHAKPGRIIELERSSYVMDVGSNGDRLSIVSNGKTIHVRGSNKEEVQDWKKDILEAIQRVQSGTSFK